MYLFVLSLCLWNLGSLVVNYYDDDKQGVSQYSQSPDDKVFQQVSRAYSEVTGHCRCWVCFSRGWNVSVWFCGVIENKIGTKATGFLWKSVERQGLKTWLQQHSLLSSHLCVMCVCRRILWCTKDNLVTTCTLRNILRMASPMVPTGTMLMVRRRLCFSPH